MKTFDLITSKELGRVFDGHAYDLAGPYLGLALIILPFLAAWPGLSGFPCAAGIMGTRSSSYVTAQRTDDTKRTARPAAGGGARPAQPLNKAACWFPLKKALTERALNEEMAHHLAGDDGAGNTRNGYGRKTVMTNTSKLTIDVPRDRQASFVEDAAI